MTKYYKQLNENAETCALLTYDFEPIITDSSVIEITEEEYAAALSEIYEKDRLVRLLYRKEVMMDDVPEKWQEEVHQRVDELITGFGEFALSEGELKAQAYDIVTGVSE